MEHRNAIVNIKVGLPPTVSQGTDEAIKNQSTTKK